MKNKKGLIIGLVILLVMVIIIVTVITLNLNKENPEDVLNTYIAYINDKNYDGMYELLRKLKKKVKILKYYIMSKCILQLEK